MECPHSVIAVLILFLLASHCSGRKQDGRPSSPKGEKREEPPIRNDDTHQQAVHFTELMPEKIFWDCMDKYGFGSSNATHAINHIIELTNNIIAMEKMFEERFGISNETIFHDFGGFLPDMFNYSSNASSFLMENCTAYFGYGNISVNVTPSSNVIQEDMISQLCALFRGDINATMRFNSSIGNGWDDFNWAISNLTMVMGLLNDSMIALHNFTASLRPEYFDGFGSEKDGQMFGEDNWRECIDKALQGLDNSSFTYDDRNPNKNGFMESKTYGTLQRLGIISAMNSLGINPSQYIRHQLRQDEGFETDHRPFIGFRIIRLIEPRRMQNLSWMDTLDLLQEVEFDRDSYSHLLSHINRSHFELLLLAGREVVHDEGMPPPSVVGGVLAAAEVHWGPVPKWTADNIDQLWLFVIGIGKEHLLHFSMEAFQAVLPHLAALHNGHQLDPFLATAVVDAAKRHWGAKISRWTIAKLQWLGPFTVHLSVQDLSAVDTDDLLVLLPDISNLHFDKRQGHAIINSLISSQDWTWSLEQFKSLGKLAAYLTVEQLKNLPPEVFSDREVQKSMVANTAGRGREVKEVAKRIVEDMGDPSTWSGEDLTRIGKVASGLEVKDLEKIPKSSIRTAVADLSKADLSPRQRMVIAQKYREASSNRTSKRLSSRDIRELKSLSVGLGSNVFAEMSPDDVKESINVLAENAAELQPTQKREIVRQMKRASGGIAGSLKDLGSMVQEVPLKDLNEMKLEDIGTDVITEVNSTEPVLSLGTIQWNKGQSTKLYRKVKKELLMTGNSSSAGLTSDTISMLGTVMVGMTCEDIELLETHDIFRLVDVMMQQDGWTLRQARCISNRVRNFFGHGHDFMRNFTLAEVNSLTGQTMKEFTPEELSHLSHDVCEVSFANVGHQKALEEMRRSKRQEIAQKALICLEKTAADSVISGEDMEALGYLGCELEPDDIERVDVADLRTSTLHIAAKCCYDRFQMVAVGLKVIEQLGSPETWTSAIIESVAPFLLYLSPHQIDVFDEDQLSAVAEGIMDMYAEYGEKLPLCERDLSGQDLEERKTGFVRVAVKVKETMVATADTSRRRKRATTYVPTCDEIDLLEDGNIAWTAEELSAIDGETFESCGYVLGGVSGFSEDQLDALLDKAKEVWGEPSQMTPDELSQLGNIATRFTVVELGELNLTDIDTVYSLSQYGNWSSEQMSAAVIQYLQVSEKSLDELNSVDIAGLDKFICGLTADEITQLNSSAYGVSATSIGTLEVCNTDQLNAFKGHAVITYGPISSWQPEIFTEVGVVIAGFTANELSSLNTTSVAGITPLAISLIPPDTFGNGFTLDVLGAFDEAQALAVTSEQLAALSSSQSLVLIEAEYGEEQVPPEVIEDIQNIESTTPEGEPEDEPEDEPEGEPEKKPEKKPNGAIKRYQRFDFIIISMAVCHLL